MKEPEKERPYDLNIGKFKSHERVFPWMFVLKVVLGLGMIAFIYFMTREMFSQKNPAPSNGIPVEIQTEQP